MFERILLPLDASPTSSRAIAALAPLLTGPESADVELLHVIPLQDEGGVADLDRLRAVEDAARDFLEGARQLTGLPKDRTPTTIRHGDPADRILEHAKERDVSLIVMTSRGQSGIARWLLGSVAARVLTNADRPVLLLQLEDIEASDAPSTFRKILLPQDGSPDAREILPLVRDMARRYGSEVLLFHSTTVTPAIAMTPGGTHPSVEPAADAEDDRLAAENALEPALCALQEAGVSVRKVVGRGNPAATILEAVEEEGVDLVAMTTHGRSGISRWLFGSVAEKVFRSCPVPLLLHRNRRE